MQNLRRTPRHRALFRSGSLLARAGQAHVSDNTASRPSTCAPWLRVPCGETTSPLCLRLPETHGAAQPRMTSSKLLRLTRRLRSSLAMAAALVASVGTLSELKVGANPERLVPCSSAVPPSRQTQRQEQAAAAADTDSVAGCSTRRRRIPPARDAAIARCCCHRPAAAGHSPAGGVRSAVSSQSLLSRLNPPKDSAPLDLLDLLAASGRLSQAHKPLAPQCVYPAAPRRRGSRSSSSGGRGGRRSSADRRSGPQEGDCRR